ncbi:MAG: carbohydrate binding family 9 domain-containing protein, partial [Candidatus Latescibacteria bacterium]|nr:carbohydrate binding family 9 domain-containing protein [Candidatus Latescibacterota bacterium]
MRRVIPGICLCILAAAATETSAQEGAPSSIRAASDLRQSGAANDSTAAAAIEQKNLTADELSASDARPETGAPDPGGSSEDRRTSLPDTPFGTPPPVETKPFDYHTLNPNDYILTAVKVTTPIKLDGRLDDDAWKLARSASRFYQLEPKEGFPASQPTEVRVLYDTENLYIGFMCYDAEPSKIVAREFKRDGPLHGSNDYVMAIIAPFEGGRESYEFMTNPNGARRDLFVSQEGSNFDQDWNGNWNAASVRHAHGWSAEMVIPFRALRFPSNSVQTWNINFGRFILRTRESAYWVPVSPQDGFRGAYKFAKGGRLTGLRDIKPGGMMEVLPFTVLGPAGTRQVVGGPTAAIPIAQTDVQYGLQRRVGGDLKWRVRSGLTADATVNPDFAQIEADDQVVNLSRFEFRFDEKRPFFLERSDIFNLGRSGGFFGGGGGR